MRFRNVVSLSLTALLSACGTFSNEDLEFAAVLPDEGLEFALPPTQTMNALVPPANSGSFDAAVTTATDLNRVAKSVTQRLRQIAGRPAAVSRTGHREWGPFIATGYPGTLRLVMDADASVKCALSGEAVSAKAKGYVWRLEVSQNGKAPFKTLATGQVRGEDFTTSCGFLQFDATVSRSFGGPETDKDPRSTRLDWSRSPGATEMTVAVTAAESDEAPLVEGRAYSFRETAAGGHFEFFRRYVPDRHLGVLHVLDAKLDWGPNGTPWRTSYQVDGEDGEELFHGLTCGDDFGRPNFDQGGVQPGFTVESEDQESCQYDFPEDEDDRDDHRPGR